MTNSAPKQKTCLPPLLQKLCNTKRYPNALLIHGENSNQLFNQMCQLAETINQTNIKNKIDSDDDYFEPTTDIIIIQQKDRIKIELIKKLQERIKYGASSNDYCIVMIHQCHNLTLSSANALLKTIEEPSQKTIFILSTVNKNRVPQTILSRCQTYYISEKNNEKTNRMTSLIDELNQKTHYISAHDFFNLNRIDKIIYIQSLPFNLSLIADILSTWQFELNQNQSSLNKKELTFLQKMIEIIKNIKYNLNLKLQLMALTLEFEEDQPNGTPR
jgi:DNA polymerase III delta prime subunit